MMDTFWESEFDFYEAFYPAKEEIPTIVDILGMRYDSVRDRKKIHNDVVSRMWFTYRKGFSPIGGPGGPTYDTGWGCMHRCGQMMLAQALINLHLGRNWRWQEDQCSPVYWKIMKMFEDNKAAIYSIHHLASMGACEGVKIGKWFGPNTVAQVIKKLSVHDRWSKLVVHVALEEGIIIDDLKRKCRSSPSSREHSRFGPSSSREHSRFGPSSSSRKHGDPESRRRGVSDIARNLRHPPVTKELGSNCVEIILPTIAVSAPTKPSPLVDVGSGKEPSPSQHNRSEWRREGQGRGWRPLLLIIPLRLGLKELNPCYYESVTALFKVPDCVGMLGGRPSHALWFIGCSGHDLLHLDPHTTQPFLNLNSLTDSGDQTCHCAKGPEKLPLSRMDPSLAVGFLFSSEAAFDRACVQIRAFSSIPLFEIHDTRPPHLPPFDHTDAASGEEDRQFDTDDDFELL